MGVAVLFGDADAVGSRETDSVTVGVTDGLLTVIDLVPDGWCVADGGALSETETVRVGDCDAVGVADTFGDAEAVTSLDSDSLLDAVVDASHDWDALTLRVSELLVERVGYTPETDTVLLAEGVAVPDCDSVAC